jgi:hypothetical protein
MSWRHGAERDVPECAPLPWRLAVSAPAISELCSTGSTLRASPHALLPVQAQPTNRPLLALQQYFVNVRYIRYLTLLERGGTGVCPCASLNLIGATTTSYVREDNASTEHRRAPSTYYHLLLDLN